MNDNHNYSRKLKTEKFNLRLIPKLPAIYLKKASWNSNGVLTFFKTELNAKLLVLATIVNIFLAIYFKYDRYETMAMSTAFVFLWVAEMLNTGVEKVVDLVTEDYSEVAKTAKDIAGGAVVLAIINTFFVFILINFFN